MKRIAIYVGNFDPPGTHHRRVAELLAQRFDEVVIVPSGVPPSNHLTSDSQSVHRAAMVDLAFRDLPKVRVDLDDLEQQRVSSHVSLEERYRPPGGGLVAHVVDAAELLSERAQYVKQLWARSHFTVLAEPNEPLNPAELPPHHEVLRVPPHLRSADVRSRIFHDEPVDGLLPTRVEAYIRRHGLF